MSPRLPRRILEIAMAAALGAPCAANAVRIDDDGLGQALIFPYYTVQSNGGDSYNTYISVVNHTAAAKAVRVRIREGRASREVASFNLFLSPNDVWTGAIVPGASLNAAPRLITTDNSCTSPAFDGAQSAVVPASLTFSNALYSGSNDDGNGTGLDRAREGFVEMIEMADVTGDSATNITHRGTGVPFNCAAIQGSAAISVAAPTGGLSGTLTQINVANGLNFDQDAVALADLSKQAFYRAASDPSADFNATEIDPVSVVVTKGALYRSLWTRPVDAVSAVLMRLSFFTEYVLDDATASNTDLVATFPTRSFYVNRTSAAAPFSAPAVWSAVCAPNGENVAATVFNREESSFVIAGSDFGIGFGTSNICAASVVFDTANANPRTVPGTATHVLGSLTRGYSTLALFLNHSDLSFSNGWMAMTFTGNSVTLPNLASLATSTRIDLATGTQTTGAHTFFGLPVVGFMARTFVNGTLQCDAGACQGSYGGAFPYQYQRVVMP